MKIARFMGAGIVFVMVAWTLLSFHAQALQQCETAWKQKLMTADLVATQQLNNAKDLAAEYQLKLDVANKAAEDKVAEYEAKLEEKRSHVPLSETCTACRVSAERSRLRQLEPEGNNSSAKTSASSADQKGTQ